MALTLYYGSGSPYAWRAQLGLEHKALAYELKILSFSAGDTRKPEFVALNPRTQVPVLLDARRISSGAAVGCRLRFLSAGGISVSRAENEASRPGRGRHAHAGAAGVEKPHRSAALLRQDHSAALESGVIADDLFARPDT